MYVMRKTHLGNNKVGRCLELIRQALPHGRQLLAVAAPRRICDWLRSRRPEASRQTELDENVVGVVENHLSEVIAGNDLDGLGVPVGRHWLRVEVLLRGMSNLVTGAKHKP